ncbi:YwhD family protein [Barrientosiimonas marina]|uniref:YwhD family protein n=1 Tax=Lentibacillus kimchii TaxID=1542911 RepID=A0ABW2UVB7_9BACI
MSDQSSDQNKNNQFTIIKDDPNDGHEGYGIGSISLENMSSVIVDPNEDKAYVDMEAMHARSAVERRVKFQSDPEAVENGKLYWIVWVTTDNGENGAYFAGVGSSHLIVDRSIKRAYKSMPEHVKHMEDSLKGKISIDNMDEHSKKLLKDFLADFEGGDMWKNSSDELKNALSE